MANGKKFPVQIVIGAVDNITLKVMEINQKIERAVKPLTQMGQSLKLLGQETGLTKVGSSAALVGERFNKFSTQLLKSVAVMTAAGYASYRLLKGTSDFASQIQDTSEALGLSTDTLQAWQFMAEKGGVSVERLDAMLSKFNGTLVDARTGSGEAAGLFRALGIDSRLLRDANAMEKVLPRIAESMSKLTDSTRAKLARELFGKGGEKFAAQLVSVAKQGPGAFKKLIQEAQGAGAIIPPEALAAADNFGDKIGAIGRAFKGLMALGLQPVFERLTELLKELGEWMGKNKDQVKQWGSDLAASLPTAQQVINGLRSLSEIVRSIASAFQFLSNIFGGANVAAAALAAVFLGPLLVSFAQLSIAMVTLGKDLGFVVVRLGMLMTGAATMQRLTMIGTGLASVFGFIKAAALAAWGAITLPVALVIAAVAAVAGAAYLIYKHWEPIKAWLSDFWRDMTDGFLEAFNWITEKLSSLASYLPKFIQTKLGLAPAIAPQAAPLGAAAISQSAAAGRNGVSTENKITIDINGLPRGSRVKTDKAEAPIDLNMGYSLAAGVP